MNVYCVVVNIAREHTHTHLCGATRKLVSSIIVNQRRRRRRKKKCSFSANIKYIISKRTNHFRVVFFVRWNLLAFKMLCTLRQVATTDWLRAAWMILLFIYVYIIHHKASMKSNQSKSIEYIRMVPLSLSLCLCLGPEPWVYHIRLVEQIYTYARLPPEPLCFSLQTQERVATTLWFIPVLRCNRAIYF